MMKRSIERIPGHVWRNSQLSIARHFGGCVINGTRYVIDRSTDELVREDVYKQATREEKKRRNAAERAHWEKQLDFFTKAQDRMAEELDKNTDDQ